MSTSPSPWLPSPVPADQDLEPDEFPFTAFGRLEPDQIDLRVFDQGVWWVDRLGTPHLIERMPSSYLAAVLDFTANLAEQYYRGILLDLRVRALREEFSLPEQARPASTPATTRMVAMSELTPQEWLEASPLTRAIRAQLALRESSTPSTPDTPACPGEQL